MNKYKTLVKTIFEIIYGGNKMIDKIALTLLIIGGINWGLVGIFQFDLVAFLCGGQSGVISRIIYIIVCLCAIWCITLLFKDTQNAKSITDTKS